MQWCFIRRDVEEPWSVVLCFSAAVYAAGTEVADPLSSTCCPYQRCRSNLLCKAVNVVQCGTSEVSLVQEMDYHHHHHHHYHPYYCYIIRQIDNNPQTSSNRLSGGTGCRVCLADRAK